VNSAEALVPSSLIDFAEMDLRGAFDVAIMIEEDAQLRYERMSRFLGDDPGGAGDVARMMVTNESKHKNELLSRRDALFREDAPRIQLSILAEGVERPDIADDDLPTTAREALEMALAAEKRAYEFYGKVIRYVKDPGVRAFFEGLMQEEAEHQRLLAEQLAKLDASATGGEDRARPQRDVSPRPPAETYPDRERLQSVLSWFDAATQAVALGVIVKGMRTDEVAADLGVSRRAVESKLTRFLAVARQHVAASLTAR
jgi:bacterioferritin (cytochrome b1)/predicted DNA-binding protein (UPF0251 family)